MGIAAVSTRLSELHGSQLGIVLPRTLQRGILVYPVPSNSGKDTDSHCA